MSKITADLAEARKALVAVATAAGEILTAGLIHGTAAHWTQVVLGVLGAIGVYVVPNKKAAAK